LQELRHTLRLPSAPPTQALRLNFRLMHSLNSRLMSSEAIRLNRSHFCQNTVRKKEARTSPSFFKS
jgi:hypothetical protein